jgi:hypothetical protein
MEPLKHDQLQSKCHIWLWNNHCELRGLFHTNFNDIKIIEKVLRAISGKSIGNDHRRIILSQLKSIGLIPGNWDQELLYKGTLYFFECKVGADHLSPEQIAFKEINEKHGARFFEYGTEDEFKGIINGIL